MAKRQYSSHGNVAYAEPVERSSPRSAAPKKVPQGSPYRRPNARPITRKRVQVREAGSISIDAILGFAVCLALAFLLMNGYAELTTNSDEIVQLRSQLGTLQAQQQVLSAQYEKHFDISRIEETLGDELIRPTNDHMVYIDLSQPDAMTIYGDEEDSTGLFKSFWNIFSK